VEFSGSVSFHPYRRLKNNSLQVKILVRKTMVMKIIMIQMGGFVHKLYVGKTQEEGKYR
jgi:hypothetical protein